MCINILQFFHIFDMLFLNCRQFRHKLQYHLIHRIPFISGIRWSSSSRVKPINIWILFIFVDFIQKVIIPFFDCGRLYFFNLEPLAGELSSAFPTVVNYSFIFDDSQILSWFIFMVIAVLSLVIRLLPKVRLSVTMIVFLVIIHEFLITLVAAMFVFLCRLIIRLCLPEGISYWAYEWPFYILFWLLV